MSALDNAFIRAYTTDAVPVAGSTAATTSPSPKHIAPQASSAATPANPMARPHFTRTVQRDNPQNSVIPAPHISLASFSHTVTTLDAAAPPAAPIPVRIDPPAVANNAPHTILMTAAPPEPDILPEDSETGELAPPAPMGNESAAHAALPRPAFEVDRLSWPETCGALLGRVGTQVDELCRELMAEAALGRKAIAIGGCSRTAGGTTLALVLARRLAAAGAKVALVDADFAAPQLAGQLGLVIGIGWETVLALPEKTALWEAMVESLEDRLTIVPLASRSRLNVSGEIATRLTDCLGQLRDAFEIVLVDVGAVAADDVQSNWLATPGSGLDAAILVVDSRTTQADRLAALNRQLLDAKIAPLGIAENFCV